jgi:hypothetical protein
VFCSRDFLGHPRRIHFQHRVNENLLPRRAVGWGIHGEVWRKDLLPIACRAETADARNEALQRNF